MKRPEWQPGDDDHLLDRAYQALDQGDPQECLHWLQQCNPKESQRCLIACRAHVDLGDRQAAHLALEQAERLGVRRAEAEWLSARGELALAEWDLKLARECFEQLSRSESSAYALERLALCADLDDCPEEAERWLSAGHLIEPQTIPTPARLTPERFERVIANVLAELEPEHRRLLESTPILVEPVPFRELAPAEDPLAVPPDALGLFVGPSIVEETSAGAGAGELPPAIYLFQRNLERLAFSEEELVEEIRTTLLHEIGHRLGFDEAGIEDLGLG